MTATLGIEGGRWVLRRGGIRVYVPVPLPEPVVWPTREIVDAHELRACLSCPARVDEPCVTSSGNVSKRDHVGRLVKRSCRCGRAVVRNATRCPSCAHERHKEQQRIHISIKRAAARERQAA